MTHPAENVPPRKLVCFNWKAPAIWPHAVADITATQTTDDRAEVNCRSCQWALGTQKHPAPSDVSSNVSGRRRHH